MFWPYKFLYKLFDINSEEPFFTPSKCRKSCKNLHSRRLISNEWHELWWLFKYWMYINVIFKRNWLFIIFCESHIWAHEIGILIRQKANLTKSLQRFYIIPAQAFWVMNKKLDINSDFILTVSRASSRMPCMKVRILGFKYLFNNLY